MPAPAPQAINTDFEDIYLTIRRKEKRVYTDEQLRKLPDIDPLHIHAGEWRIRKRSCMRLLNYLSKKRKPLSILEVGCGNGWLSGKIAGIPGTQVTALDVNQAEVNQAIKVFEKDNLRFVYDTFNDSTFERERFDMIVFAASLQYFPSVINVLNQALAVLNNRGEIHIIDTPFYDALEAIDADERSRKYYNSLGYPEMADHYHHHSIIEFWGFKYKVLFNPGNPLNRLFKKGPFYWIVIRK